MLVVVLVSLQAALLIVFQFPAVQTSLVHLVSKGLSNGPINGKLSIGKVYFVFFNNLILNDVSIVSTDKSPLLDSLKIHYNQSDTLVSARKVAIKLSPSELFKLNIKLDKVTISDGVFNLQEEGDRLSNLDRIFYLNQPSPKDTTQSSLMLEANSLKLNNFRFTLNTPQKAQFEGDSIINFSNLRVSDIYVDLSDIQLVRDTLYAVVNNISGRDISGFTLKNLSGNVRVCGTETLISDLLMQDSYSTVDADYFYMRYKTAKDFSDFTSKVELGAKFTGTYLDFHTIGRITPTLYNSSLGFTIDGEVSGPVRDMRSESLRVATKTGLSYIDFKAKVIGLPNVSKTMAIAEVKNSGTTFRDLAKIVASIDNDPINRSLAAMSPFTYYKFKGVLSGLLDDFAIDGLITSPAGNADVDIIYRNEKAGSRFIGDIQTFNLNLGRILGNDFLGELSFKGKANALFGKGEDGMRIVIDTAQISNVGINGYDYSNIIACGELTERTFNGYVESNDPNLSLVYNGLLSFVMDGESKYDFTANLGHANLQELNLNTGTDVTKLSFDANVSFVNKDNNYFNGNIDLNDISYATLSDEYKLEAISINTLSSDTLYKASLVSDIALIEYSGSGSIPVFVNKVKDMAISSKLDNYLKYDSTIVYDSGAYNLFVETYDSYNLTKVLVPGLFIMDSTQVNVQINKDDKLYANIKSGRLALGANYIKKLNLNLISSPTSPSILNLTSDRIRLAGMMTDHNDVLITADTNRIGLGLSFKNDSTESDNAIMLGHVDFNDNKEIDVNILDGSSITLRGEKWNFTPAIIKFADSTISVENFNIINDSQSFSLNGNISQKYADTLNFGLKNFNIGILNLFMDKDFKLEGHFSGNGIISDLYRDPKVFFNINGDDVSAYGNKVGKLKLMSKWDQTGKQLNLLAKSNLDDKANFHATGYYKPETGFIDVNASLDELSLTYFEPFLEGIISRSSGSVTGDLKLFGTLDKLALVGSDCKFNNLGFVLDYTNVPYKLNGIFDLNEKGIFFDNLPIYDNFNNKGVVNGNLSYDYFRDLALNLNIDFTNLHALNTTEKENEYFYGKAFATGDVKIHGPLSTIGIDINVIANKNTSIHIPLSSSSSATETNLLTFVEPQKDIWVDPYEELSSNNLKTASSPTTLDVNVIAKATPDAEILIEINKAVGDVIKANGSGDIRLDIRPSNDIFDIFGDYKVDAGSYKFVLGGFAAKDFTLEPGGSIIFNGDLANTNLNLDAVYHTKASINTLIADTSSVSARRNVNCIIGMQGRMMNPELDFKIDIPDLDPTTKIRVESALNTPGKIQKQFMALLVSGGFIPDEQSGIANNSSILYSNASEILSNQINMIFQQLGIPLDLGLNYQPGERGSDIFDVAVSTQLFNNRVIINGNIGNDPYGTSRSDVVGNIDVEVKLDNSGNLRLNLFSHSEDKYSAYNDNSNSQRSGVGVLYQKEFNYFKNLLKGKSKAEKAYRKQERSKRKALKKKENQK